MIADRLHAPGRGTIARMRRTLAIVLFASLVSCGGNEPSTGPDHVVRFPGAEPVLHVRVADSDEERAQGLMGLDALPADEGMAFVWDEPVETTFWMKDTLIPLSIAFVGPDDRIVTIAEMTPCRADPCPTYAADAPFVLAIEADPGFFAGAGIVEGDRALLEAAP
jgi:uncharacterized membrane protein (UPF0127 family)